MLFNPIDIIRAQEASQLKHIQNQRLHQMQDQFGRNFQQSIEHERHKPTELTKSENTEYRYDAKNKSSNQYYNDGNNKKKKQKEKERPKTKDRPGDGSIDVRI